MTVHYLEWLERAPGDRIALVDDTASITYNQLLQEARRLAGRIAEVSGCKKYLLLPAEKTIAFLERFLAVSFSGNIPVPVDPLSPALVINQQLQQCGNAALLDDDYFDRTCPEVQPLDQRDHRLPALILFTSGTSGVPKGVVISQQNVAHSALAISEYLEYRRYPSAAVVLPLHYSYALLSQIFCQFYVGGTSYLFASFKNPIKFARRTNEEAIQTFCGVPSTYSALSMIHELSPLNMPKVRITCSAGAAMDMALLEVVHEIFPNAHFYNNYGMTEATPRISYIRDDDEHFALGSCGKPIRGLEVCTFSEETGMRNDNGSRGILGIRGPNVFANYLNDSKSTAKAFTKEGFLLSGDVGRIEDGNIYVEGRSDEIFNVGGEKIAPLELESAISRHPQVVACAVSKLVDKKRGLVPAAYLQIDQNASCSKPVTRRAMVEFLRDYLTPVKIPLRYFEVDALPQTSNGKLRRSQLSPDDVDVVIREIR